MAYTTYLVLSLIDNRLIIAGAKKVTLARLYTFLKSHSRVHIHAPGCLKELDEMSFSFVENSSKREEILNEAEAFIENIECEEVKKMICQLAITF